MEARALISPHRGFDIGPGPNKPLKTVITGGSVGVVIDTRGRPLTLPDESQERQKKIFEWVNSIGLYPEDQMTRLMEK